MKEKQNLLYIFLIMSFVVVLVLSNIAASNTFYINEFISLSAAEFLFPISYIIGDLLVEFYGGKTATKIIISGLSLTLLSSIFLFVTTLIPSNYPEYNTVFGTISNGVIGITFAGLIAYLIGSLLNTYVMDKLKTKESDKKSSSKFFKRAIISSIISEVIDSIIFITLCCAFAPNFYYWSKLLSFVITISSIKIIIEIILFPVTNYLRKLAYKKNLIIKNK